jgi:hypothetical protein
MNLKIFALSMLFLSLPAMASVTTSVAGVEFSPLGQGTTLDLKYGEAAIYKTSGLIATIIMDGAADGKATVTLMIQLTCAPVANCADNSSVTANNANLVIGQTNLLSAEAAAYSFELLSTKPGEAVFKVFAPTASVNSPNKQAAGHVTISGTAVGAPSLMVEVYAGISSTSAGNAYQVPVVNGHWSVTANDLPAGQYSIDILDGTEATGMGGSTITIMPSAR